MVKSLYLNYIQYLMKLAAAHWAYHEGEEVRKYSALGKKHITFERTTVTKTLHNHNITWIEKQDCPMSCHAQYSDSFVKNGIKQVQLI